MAVRKIQTKRRCICYTRKASKNEENLRTQAHDVESVRITRLDDGEKLRKREYSRELLSIYGEWKKANAFRRMQLMDRTRNKYCVVCESFRYVMFPEDNLDHAREKLLRYFK